ncbi:unnamed protein product [Orchesella dallaii]|uniref:Uncharacterized protein n=1 Tax=Orchesella dallaii TaxID=48710 RepID=A0ABP1PVN3_9HEXA
MFNHKVYLLLIMFSVLISSGTGKSVSYDQNVDEGGCSSYETSHTIDRFNLHRRSPTNGWIILMSSKHIAYHLGMSLNGDKTLPEEEMKNLCIRVDKYGIQSYYHKRQETLLNCTYSNFENIYCYSTDANRHPHESGPVKITFVWNDYYTYNVLMVMCADEPNEKYWMMGSNSEELSSSVKSTVLSYVSKLGFDTDKTLYHERSRCTEGGLEETGWLG